MARSRCVVLLCSVVVGCFEPDDPARQDDTASQVSGFSVSSSGTSTTGSNGSSSASSSSGTLGATEESAADTDEELDDTGGDTSAAATSSRDATTGTSGDSSSTTTSSTSTSETSVDLPDETSASTLSSGESSGDPVESSSESGDDEPGGVTFADIYPILTANCSTIQCHGDNAVNNHPEFAASDMQYAENVAVQWETTAPMRDRILTRISNPAIPTERMPRNRNPLPEENIALIRAWAESL